MGAPPVTCVRFHDSLPVVKSKKLSTKLFGLCSDESIISHWMILNRYLLFCVYPFSLFSDDFKNYGGKWVANRLNSTHKSL